MLIFYVSFIAEEIVYILFIIGIVAFIPLLVIAFLIFKIWQNKKNANSFAQLAPSLGLQFEQKSIPKLKGIYTDCEVEMGLSSRSHGTGEDRRIEYFTYCEAYFPHSLRFLLDISCPQGWD